MSTLVKRILSALILGPLAISAVWMGDWPFFVMMAVVFAISVQEWARLSLKDKRVEWLLLVGGIVYLALGCLCAVWLREHEAWGFYLLLYVFFAIWACDIGAFAVGKVVGGPKMAPSISPNKTWAGLIGGCIAAVIVVMTYDVWLGARIGAPVIERFSPFFHFLLGLLLSVIGQLGDLSISVLKRRVNLKDTGNIIPGHGGLLDRIDALLLAIPAYTLVVVYLEWIT